MPPVFRTTKNILKQNSNNNKIQTIPFSGQTVPVSFVSMRLVQYTLFFFHGYLFLFLNFTPAARYVSQIVNSLPF